MEGDNSTPSKALRKAAKQGSEDGVLKAIADGAMVNSKDQRGWTALHLACKGNHLGVVRLLCEQADANVNAQTLEQSTPLVVCAYNGRVDICQYLLGDRSADPAIVDHVGHTPLVIARARKKSLVVAVLDPHPVTKKLKTGD